MHFQPYPTRSGFVSLGIALISAAIAVFLITLLPQQNNLPDVFKLLLGVFVMLGLTSTALYWTQIAFRLDYHLNRNGLAIQWGFAQQLIPFESIKNIIPGQELSTSTTFKGINIAGLRFGWGELAGYGAIKFYTTATLANSLLIVTPGQSYVISPRQPGKFLHAWQARQSLGPTQTWPAGIRRNWPLNTPLLADPLTWRLLGLAALTCLALFGYLSLTFPELPRQLPIQFDISGQARMADKSILFAFPGLGLFIMILNAILGSLIYRYEKVGAYLLWGSAIAMQVCLWVAVLTIVP